MALWTACMLIINLPLIVNNNGILNIRVILEGGVLPLALAGAWVVFFVFLYRESRRVKVSAAAGVAASLVIAAMGLLAVLLFNRLIYVGSNAYYDPRADLRALTVFVGWSSFLVLFVRCRDKSGVSFASRVAALLVFLSTAAMIAFSLFEPDKFEASANLLVYALGAILFLGWAGLLCFFVLRGKQQTASSILPVLALVLAILVAADGLYRTYGYVRVDSASFKGHPLQMYAARRGRPIAVTLAWASQTLFLLVVWMNRSRQVNKALKT